MTVHPAAVLPSRVHVTSVPSAKIGPNAIIQVGEAVRREKGEAAAHALFLRAGLEHFLACPPAAMVDERDVVALHRALGLECTEDERARLSTTAGRLTGDYLLAHRIPRLAQIALGWLPRPLAVRALAAAITRNAWTFSGSGTFRVIRGRPLRFEIAHCPLCAGPRADRPLCDYFAGTFARLFEVLVSPEIVVSRSSCCAEGACACAFEIKW